MNSIALNKRALLRFWVRVDKRGEGDCWLWIGCKQTRGYGSFAIRGKGISAHRFSWKIHFGDIPDGMVVCHKCDNPPCVNPNHLFLGTQAENQHDKRLKGRSARGEGNNKAKLTESNVKEIRKLIDLGLSSRNIAKGFGVRHAAILDIKSGKNWSWLK